LEDHLKFYDGRDWHDAGTFPATADNGSGLVGLTEDGKAFVRFARDVQSMEILTTESLSAAGAEATLFSNPQYDVAAALTDDWTGHVIGAA